MVVYIFFSFLYNSSLYLSLYENDLFDLALIEDRSLVLLHVKMSSFLNFFAAFFVYFRNGFRGFYAYQEVRVYSVLSRFNFFYLFFYFLFSFLLLYYGSDYGWHAYSHGFSGGFATSLYFYLRLFFSAMLVFYVMKSGFNIFFIPMFFIFLLVTFVDGGRTAALPAMAFLGYIYVSKSKNTLEIILISFSLFSLMIIVRAFYMSHYESLLAAAYDSIIIEGVMGAYGSLQVLDVIVKGQVENYTYLLSYIYDPFVWIVPFSEGSFKFFDFFIESNFSAYSLERFSPMGGFYFLAEANAGIPYFGGFLVLFFFLFFSIFLERRQQFYPFLFAAFYLGVGFLFVKTNFGNAVKISVIYFCFFVFLDFFQKNLFLFRLGEKR